jgi:NADPH-dependent 2,4-dienoyl-CoA reductase/sulfur reductase-like enzyme/GMP synthase-like glutamine amidotransferase
VPERPIVIVGASLAGLRAAQAIRAAGHEGPVVVAGEEPHLPYTRPPLSKELLQGAKEPAECALPGADVEVEWRLGTAATALDPAARRITLEGEELEYDRVLLATGARAREWPWQPVELEGLHTLRTVEDALALRAALTSGRPRLAVIGGGFIGCEVAASARSLGVEVTMIDVAPQPMPALGPELGARCARVHREHGVELKLGSGVTGLHGTGRLEAVELADGTRVEADLAVIALGALPNTEWLRDSGLELQPGVVCDATLRAEGFEHVFCAGDIASWPHPMAGGERIRIEHWTNAAEQGGAAARNLLAAPADRVAHASVPYFWTDQYDLKVQVIGLAARAERTVMLEAVEGGEAFVAAGVRAGRVVAAFAFNATRRLSFYRKRLAAMPPLDELAAEARADPKMLGAPPPPTRARVRALNISAPAHERAGQRPVLIRQHGPTAPPGLLADWLHDRGLASELSCSWTGEPAPDPTRYAFVASLGSRFNPAETHEPVVASELALLERAVGHDVPVLGLCFGGQALAAVLGGRVEPGPAPELGWIEIETDDPRAVPGGPWLSWHFDRFSVPPGATEIARSPLAPQAFRHGPHLATQFHPESTVDIVAGWARKDVARLAARGIGDGEQRLAAPPERARAARAAAFALFDAFWEDVEGATTARRG